MRVADEVVVDLMKEACRVDYRQAIEQVDRVRIQGVEIPFARRELLLRMKQTVREKDALDRAFPSELLERRRGAAPNS